MHTRAAVPLPQINTRHGPTIAARKVVMATHMPLVANLAVVSRQVPERFYSVALEAPKASLPRASDP